MAAMLERLSMACSTSGGTLTFSAEAEYDSAEQVQGVCITLKDTGRGMDAETLAQAHHAHFTTKPYGAGMGATLAHDFVRSARGRLETTSELGRGTQVTLRLPALHTSSLDTTLSRFCTSAQSTSSRLLTAA